jgi:hypothetical protein
MKKTFNCFSIVTIIVYALITIDCQGQQKGNDTSLCFFNHANLPVNICYPCEWKENKKNLQPDVITQFYNHISDSTIAVISISSADYTAPNYETKEFMKTNKFAQALMREKEILISKESFKIDNIDGIEITSKKEQYGTWMYAQANYILCKNQVVVVTYFVAQRTDEAAKSMMKTYKPLFKRLRDKIKVGKN